MDFRPTRISIPAAILVITPKHGANRNCQQLQAPQAVNVGGLAAWENLPQSSIGGTVLNMKGGKPEGGVWVIAGTKSLPVPFRKIVVTDDHGLFRIPDLPAVAMKFGSVATG